MEISGFKAVTGWEANPKVPRELIQKAEYLCQRVSGAFSERAQALRHEIRTGSFRYRGNAGVESQLNELAAEAGVDLAPKAYSKIEVPDVYLRAGLNPKYGATRRDGYVRIESLAEDVPAVEGEFKEVSQAELEAFIARFEALEPAERAEVGKALKKQAAKTKWGRAGISALGALAFIGMMAAGINVAAVAWPIMMLMAVLLPKLVVDLAFDYKAKPTNPLPKHLATAAS